jgi:hypothetical protein
MNKHVVAEQHVKPFAASRTAGPIYNQRGIIAEHYRDLQGLPVLEAARARNPQPKASAASTIRAVFQACEIGLLNLADLMVRAAEDIAEARIGTAMVKLSWSRGFHRVLGRLSLMPAQLGLIPGSRDQTSHLSIADSPAFAEYLRALRRFDAAMLGAIQAGTVPLDATLANDSLDSPLFALVHSTRVGNHESTIWEDNLTDVPVAAVLSSYEDFVSASGMRAAVYDRVLHGDTYFTQFRGLHQIPETLGEEANDHLEQAVRDLRAGRLEAASDRLRVATVLAEGMLASLPPMADNLATSDYHLIRENLGLTSGSHSVCLRFHMFSDLYQSLAHALSDVDERAADPAPWLVERVRSEFLTFRSLIFQWRDQHLHLPRNNLGGGSTKSLTGSPDAVVAVRKMRRAARTSDPALWLARSRNFKGPSADERASPLRAYLDSDESLDAYVLLATGQVTQERFVQVQERLGFFANRCPFVAPPPRRA